MATNRQILAAVLVKWAQPAIEQFATSKLSLLPFFEIANNKVRSTGFVSPAWSLERELMPMAGGLVKALAEPALASMLDGVPDGMIPQMAHGIVDSAIENGQLSLFEGKVVFEREDLEELKRYLNYNLPYDAGESYKVLEAENPAPTATGAEQNG